MSLRNQLIGTWKSDRKRTLDGFAAYYKHMSLYTSQRNYTEWFPKVKTG